MRLLAVAVLAGAVLGLFGDGAERALRYERGEALAQPWRLLTAHLVHHGWPHYGLNAATAAVVIALFGRRLTAVTLLWCAAAVSAGLYLLAPQIGWYVGLSGVLHGPLAAGIVREARAGRRAWLRGLALLAGKVAWELLDGPLPAVARMTGARVVVEAHLFGALAGALAGLLPARRRKR